MTAEVPEEALFQRARRDYHKRLSGKVLRLESGVPSNADRSSKASCAIALGIFEKIGHDIAGLKLKGQTAGVEFELANTGFMRDTFLRLSHIRPGDWAVRKIGEKETKPRKGQARDFERLVNIAQFEQYRHLVAIAKAARSNPELAASLGSDYLIKRTS